MRYDTVDLVPATTADADVEVPVGAGSESGASGTMAGSETACTRWFPNSSSRPPLNSTLRSIVDMTAFSELTPSNCGAADADAYPRDESTVDAQPTI